MSSPYRLLAARPRETPAPAARAVIARRDATRSSMPFAVIVMCFFLPAAKDCDKVVSPFDLCVDGWMWLVWLAPTYLGAGLLLASVAHARLHGIAPRGLLAGIVAFASGAVSVFMLVSLFEKSSWLIAVHALALAGSFTLLVKAFRRSGWMRFFHFSSAWMIGSLPIALLNVFEGKYWGACLFLCAYGTLLVVRIWSIAAMVRAKCESESLARLAIRGPSLRV